MTMITLWMILFHFDTVLYVLILIMYDNYPQLDLMY